MGQAQAMRLCIVADPFTEEPRPSSNSSSRHHWYAPDPFRLFDHPLAGLAQQQSQQPQIVQLSTPFSKLPQNVQSGLQEIE
jgi:hypothetical protein